jgi:hypothetical protein
LTTEPPVLVRRAYVAALGDSRADPYESSALIVSGIYICAPRLSTSTRHEEPTWRSRARSAQARHASSMQARNTPGTTMTQARDIASDLGLRMRAGDGNRTRTISWEASQYGRLGRPTSQLGVRQVPPLTMSHRG